MCLFLSQVLTIKIEIRKMKAKLPDFFQLTGKGRREKLEKRSDADFSGRGKKGSVRETQ